MILSSIKDFKRFASSVRHKSKACPKNGSTYVPSYFIYITVRGIQIVNAFKKRFTINTSCTLLPLGNEGSFHILAPSKEKRLTVFIIILINGYNNMGA